MRWSNPDFDPPWNFRGNPTEVINLISAGWLPKAGSVLDIGCGEGDLACWFAKQGYICTGIDVAEAAISRARTRHNDCGEVRYEVLDICSHVPSGVPFNIVIDRGCLHRLPQQLIHLYVANVAAACQPGARMLIFAKDGREPKGYANNLLQYPLPRPLNRFLRRRRIAKSFHSWFEIVHESQIDLRSSDDYDSIPGVVYQLVRISRMQ
jgi:SAM-dependent methyltransferase